MFLKKIYTSTSECRNWWLFPAKQCTGEHLQPLFGVCSWVWSCVQSSAGDTGIKWPACQPRRPAAASATPSRLLKGDTISINVFLSTLRRCLFNPSPGEFGARRARVKLHLSALKENRCDKRVMDVHGQSGSTGDAVRAFGPFLYVTVLLFIWNHSWVNRIRRGELHR